MDGVPLPQRKSIRLSGFDYSESRAYFVTICTFQRRLLFGHVNDGHVQLSGIGQIAKGEWEQLPVHLAYIELDLFVVMPNHLHAIFIIKSTPANDVGTRLGASVNCPTPLTLGKIINLYKGGVTRKVKALIGTNAPRIWQGRFHDRIIRNNDEIQRIRTYIEFNPAKWAEDDYFNV